MSGNNVVTVLFCVLHSCRLRTESDALAEAQRALRTAQQDLSKRDSDLKAALADSAAAKRAKKDMDKELAMAKEDADAARTQLEGETVARVDAENNLQSVREDMDFKQQLFDKVKTQSVTETIPVP